MTIPIIKVGAWEIDGQELDVPTETNLSVENIHSTSLLYGLNNLIDILEYVRNSSSVITYNKVSETTFTTSSATPVNLTSLNIVPDTGWYKADFFANASHSANNNVISCGIYLDGVLVTSSVARAQTTGSNYSIILSSQTVFYTPGDKTVEVRVARNSGGTLTITNRSLCLIKVAPPL
jgi:hypothetical protein